MVIRIPVNSRAGELSGEVTKEIRYASRPMEDLEGTYLERSTATGGPVVQKIILDDISSGQARSLLITFIVSLAILTFIFLITRRALLLGLITLLPLVLVIAWTLGGMYFFGIPLNVVTVTISAITVGLGIDYAIHFCLNYVEARVEAQSHFEALRLTGERKALELLKQALAHNLRYNDGDSAVPILRDLAETYLWLNDLDEGLAMLAALLRNDPADVWTYNLMAITLPWVELVAGVLLILGWKSRAAALLVFGMMVTFLSHLNWSVGNPLSGNAAVYP